MLMIPYLPATSGFSSVLSFMTLSLALYSEASSSTMGATIWQGPHHTAQKSTKTKPWAFATSASQVEELTGVALLTSTSNDSVWLNSDAVVSKIVAQPARWCQCDGSLRLH